MLHALIMAGGGGTRFWPRSRQSRPKQFLTLTGDQTLLRQTYARIETLVGAERTWILTAARHVDLTREQVPEIPAEQIVGEPCGRDTAPCVALAAALIARRDADATMLVLAADHVIEPEQEFHRAIHAAEQTVQEHPAALITFGVKPARPATGYGYVQRGDALPSRQGVAVYNVRQFKEKPTSKVAEEYVASGEYYWNSGMFVWKAKTILDLLAANAPEIHERAQRITDARDTANRESVFEKEFAAMPKISIDYAVMEKAAEVLVAAAPFQWDDVGSWLALERLHPQDADGNTVLARHLGLDTKNCVIVGDGTTMLTTIGVDNLLVVQDGDAVLVADKNDEGAIKKLVERLGATGNERFT